MPRYPRAIQTIAFVPALARACQDEDGLLLAHGSVLSGKSHIWLHMESDALHLRQEQFSYIHAYCFRFTTHFITECTIILCLLCLPIFGLPRCLLSYDFRFSITRTGRLEIEWNSTCQIRSWSHGCKVFSFHQCSRVVYPHSLYKVQSRALWRESRLVTLFDISMIALSTSSSSWWKPHQGNTWHRQIIHQRNVNRHTRKLRKYMWHRMSRLQQPLNHSSMKIRNCEWLSFSGSASFELRYENIIEINTCRGRCIVVDTVTVTSSNHLFSLSPELPLVVAKIDCICGPKWRAYRLVRIQEDEDMARSLFQTSLMYGPVDCDTA